MVNIETIRYYERIGILPKPPRSRGGHRLYTHEHKQHLVFIRRSRELGFSLDQVRLLLGLASGRGMACATVKNITEQQSLISGKGWKTSSVSSAFSLLWSGDVPKTKA